MELSTKISNGFKSSKPQTHHKISSTAKSTPSTPYSMSSDHKNSHNNIVNDSNISDVTQNHWRKLLSIDLQPLIQNISTDFVAKVVDDYCFLFFSRKYRNLFYFTILYFIIFYLYVLFSKDFYFKFM